MKFIKRLTLIFSAIAFCFSLAVVSADAQSRNRSWNNRNNNDRLENRSNRSWRNRNRRNNSWQNRSWQNRNRQNVYWQQNRYGRITPQEYRQLQRKRAQLYRTRNRYSSDGYISSKERRKLQKRYSKYQRRVRRDTRDW